MFMPLGASVLSLKITLGYHSPLISVHQSNPWEKSENVNIKATVGPIAWKLFSSKKEMSVSQYGAPAHTSKANQTWPRNLPPNRYDTEMIAKDGWSAQSNLTLDTLKGFKAAVNVKAALTSFNTAFLSISRSHFKQCQISLLISLTTVWRFCINFWVIFGHFGKEIFFLKG